MKTSILLLLVTLSFFLTASAQSSEQKSGSQQQTSPALQEATKLNAEVVKLFGQKKFNEALPLAQKVVTIREAELGKNDLSVALAYWNLAFIQSSLDKRKEAEKSFENAFNIYEKNQPLSSSDEKNFIQLLELVATNQAFNGKIDEAEKKLQRAIELSEKVYGGDSIETANSLSKLSDLYQAVGDFQKAAPLLLRTLDIKSKKDGLKSEETDETFQSVSCVLTKLGREQELEKIQNKFYPPKITDNFAPPIQTGVINGMALKLITPPYPAEAREKRASGQVEVKVIINESGDVIHACAVKGAKELQRASELAAYGSKFTPTILKGKSVKVTGKIIYNFVAY